MDEEKSSKFEHLHQKISDVEDRFHEINDQTNKKFGIVKDNVTAYLKSAYKNHKTNRGRQS